MPADPGGDGWLHRGGGAGAASCKRLRDCRHRHRGRGQGARESMAFPENEGSFVLLEHKHYGVGEWLEKKLEC